MNSRFKRAMFVIDTPLGHSASQAPVFVQLPNPNSSILANIDFARRAASTFPCGNSANWLTFADTNSIADPFLHAATHAPHPIHDAASIAKSASRFGMVIEFATCAPPAFTD